MKVIDRELWQIWSKENLVKSRNDRMRVEKAYSSLEDKTTHYAGSTHLLLKAKKEVESIWEKATEEAK